MATQSNKLTVKEVETLTYSTGTSNKESSRAYNANRHTKPPLSKSAKTSGTLNSLIAREQELLAKKFPSSA